MTTTYHTACSIDWLINRINDAKTIKGKNEWALCFIKKPTFWKAPYQELLDELYKMKAKGLDVFVNTDCDNVLENWYCGGHLVENSNSLQNKDE